MGSHNLPKAQNSPYLMLLWAAVPVVGILGSFAYVIYKDVTGRQATDTRLARECNISQEHILIHVHDKYFCVRGRILE